VRNFPDTLNFIAAKCVRCGKCRKECAFLEKYGFPGDIAQNYAGRQSFHDRTKTICCGEGGSVTCVAPELAQNWRQ